MIRARVKWIFYLTAFHFKKGQMFKFHFRLVTYLRSNWFFTCHLPTFFWKNIECVIEYLDLPWWKKKKAFSETIKSHFATSKNNHKYNAWFKTLFVNVRSLSHQVWKTGIFDDSWLMISSCFWSFLGYLKVKF